MTFTADDVGPIRNVNGISVRLTDVERAEIAQEWTRNDEAFRARLSAHRLSSMRASAVQAVTASMLEQALSSPDAPPEVKAYAAALSGAK